MKATPVSATAPAKVILFGEHAVVYGCPAIAVPISALRAEALAFPNSSYGLGLRIAAFDSGETIPVDLTSDMKAVDNALAYTARLCLEALNAAPPDVTIRIQSQIPIASGLGSGAAVTAALARVLSFVVGQPLDNDRLNALVYEVEKLYHGTPSGIDNTVIVYEQPVYFRRGYPIETLDIVRPFTLLIGDTGEAALTRTVVEDVRRLYTSDPEQYQALFNEIASITELGRRAISTGDHNLLGKLMFQNHTILQQLTVSSAPLDSLVQAAYAAGAIGAKLSGGGRGGNMIALTEARDAERVEKALLSAGAKRVFQTVVQ